MALSIKNPEVDERIRRFGLTVVPADDRILRSAWLANVPLLCVGDDVARTDIVLAL